MFHLLITTPDGLYATRRIQQEAVGLGIEADCRDVRDLATWGWKIEVEKYDALWVRQANPYYTEVIELAKNLKAQGKPVVDSRIPTQGIQDGKFGLLTQLQLSGLHVPQTSMYEGFSLSVRGEPLYPFILKWNYGAKAKHVYFVETHAQLERLLQKYPAGECIRQEYIPAQFEYKVITVGYKSLPVVVKYCTNPRTKVADLENFEVVNALSIPEVVRMAEQGSRILGRELAKSDILEKDGKYYLLEVNRQPGLESFERASGVNVARVFLKYIRENIS